MIQTARNFLLIVAALLGGCQPSNGGAIDIVDARSPATPPGATVAAVYLQINAARSDRLLAAHTPIAERIEMHATTTDANGMMQMRPAEAIGLTADTPLEFKPGGLHLMLVGLQRPLNEGDTFAVTFRFEQAGEVAVDVKVVAPASL